MVVALFITLSPIWILCFAVPMAELASEILGLTKLNWNTASFSTYLPITIKFANEVSKILSELPPEKVTKDHYRFFM